MEKEMEEKPEVLKLDLALEKLKRADNAILARIQLKNLTAETIKCNLYLGWRHPAGIVTRPVQKNVVLKPYQVITETDMHIPKASGKREITVVVYKGAETLAQKKLTFDT